MNSWRDARLLLLLTLAAMSARPGVPAIRAQTGENKVRLIHSTPLPNWGQVRAVAADAEGNAYLTGYAEAGRLSTSAEVVQPQARGALDPFVAKVDAAGRVVWATYLGGSAGRYGKGDMGIAEAGSDIAVDPSGYIYVAGYTQSRDFPLVNAFQTAAAASAGFLAKLDPTGRRLVYSTYVGGSTGSSSGAVVAATPLGEAYVVGGTSSRDLDVTYPYADPRATTWSFATKVGPAGRALYSLTFGDGDVSDAAVDGTGSLHVAARASVIKFATHGNEVVYRTSLSGEGPPFPMIQAITLDHQGRALVVGGARSIDFPLVRSLRSDFRRSDAFLVRLTRAGTIDFSTLIGGSGDEHAVAVGVDLAGAVYVAGTTLSLDLPLARALRETHPDASVLRSGDGGISWDRISDQPLSFQQLLVDPNNTNVLWGVTRGIIFVGRDGWTPALYRSIDRGRSWVGVPFPAPYIDHLAISPHSSATLFAVASGGLYKTVDSGDRWALVDPSDSRVNVPRFVVVSPTNPNKVYAGGYGLRISEDGGTTWMTRNEGLPRWSGEQRYPVEAIVLDPRRPGTVYVGVAPGVYKTTDDGLTWSPVLVGYRDAGGFTSVYVRTMASSRDATRLYVGTFDGAFFSADAGATWRQAIPRQAIERLVVDPNNGAVVYGMRRFAAPLHRSVDGGHTWRRVEVPASRSGIATVTFDPKAAGTVYAAAAIEGAPFVMRLIPRAASNGPAFEIAGATYVGAASVQEAAVDPRGRVVLQTLEALESRPWETRLFLVDGTSAR